MIDMTRMVKGFLTLNFSIYQNPDEPFYRIFVPVFIFCSFFRYPAGQVFGFYLFLLHFRPDAPLGNELLQEIKIRVLGVNLIFVQAIVYMDGIPLTAYLHVLHIFEL